MKAKELLLHYVCTDDAYQTVHKYCKVWQFSNQLVVKCDSDSLNADFYLDTDDIDTLKEDYRFDYIDYFDLGKTVEITKLDLAQLWSYSENVQNYDYNCLDKVKELLHTKSATE